MLNTLDKAFLPDFRQIAETAEEGIWVIDETDCTKFVNKKICSILGYTPEEIAGTGICHFMNEQSARQSVAQAETRKQGKNEVYEAVLLTKSGKKIWVTISANPFVFQDEKYSGALFLITDITERKRTEQEMSWLINNTEECFILLNHELQIVSFNKQFQTLYLLYYGINVSRGDSILDYAQTGHRERLQKLYNRVLQGTTQEAQITLTAPGLTAKIFCLKYKPAKNEEGQTIGAFVSIVDITDKIKSEKKLISNERRYRALIENGMDAVVILTAQGKPIYSSRGVETVLGYTEAEALKLDLFSVVHPDEVAKMKVLWQTVMETSGQPVQGHPLRVLHKDGSWRWIEGVFTNMLHDASINGIVDNFRDISEKIKAEEQKGFEKRDTDALINTTEDLMWSVDSDLKLRAANHSFVNSLKKGTGLTLKAGDELMMRGKYPDDFLTLWNQLYNRALRGESFIQEIHTPAGDNYPETWAETRFNPIYDNDKITGIACYSRDTSTSRSFKDKLITVNKKLETAQQTAQLGYWESGIDEHSLVWSDEVYKIWGVARDSFETNYTNFYNSIHPDDREFFTASQVPAFAGEKKLDVEHRIVLPDGSTKYVHERGELIFDINGNPKHFEGTVQDITERKIAEGKIRESELRYRSLIEQATDAICIADASMKFIDMNPYACNIFGYNKDEALKLYLTDILFTEDLKTNPLKLDEVMSGKTIINERRLKRKDGTAVLMEVSTKMTEDGRFVMFGHDITKRKSAENQIKESNKRFEYVTKATSDAIWDWNMINQTIYWGEGLQTIFGYNPRKIKTDISSWTDYIHPEDVKRVNEGIEDFIDGTGAKWEDQYRYLKSDQTYAYVIDRGFAIRNENGKVTRMVGAMQDITKRKKDESELQQVQSRLLGIIASQTNYIIRTDLSGNYTYYNPKFIDDFGWLYEKKNLMGSSAMSSIMEYHHQHVMETVEKCFAKKNEVFQVEIDKPAISGGVKTTLWDFICLTDFNGQPTEIQCVGIDISQRKKAESAFIDTLKEKNTILESIGDAFFAVDKNWMVTYWNSKAEKMLNVTRQEIVGFNLWEVFHDSVDSESFKKYMQAVETKKVTQFEDFYAVNAKWYDITAYPSDAGLSVYFKDITERKLSDISLHALNEDIKQNSRKLAESNAELEQFAYVASHDLQEPLRMVTSYLTQLEKKYGAIIDEKGKKYIHFAVDGARRMRQIILDLLEYSRVGRTEESLENIDLNNIVGEIRILYRKQIEEKNANILVDTLPTLMAYKAPVRQVFQNLISNALKYTVKDVPAVIHIAVTDLKNYWQFSVADNGIGIDKEYFDKIFLIFQRLHNKDEFSGTGVGLAVTKKIIENMGGSIWVESEEGKGSCFSFTILKS